jgi:hypothetical protein
MPEPLNNRVCRSVAPSVLGVCTPVLDVDEVWAAQQEGEFARRENLQGELRDHWVEAVCERRYFLLRLIVKVPLSYLVDNLFSIF